jgi:hypothetical protein
MKYTAYGVSLAVYLIFLHEMPPDGVFLHETLPDTAFLHEMLPDTARRYQTVPDTGIHLHTLPDMTYTAYGVSLAVYLIYVHEMPPDSV